MILGIGHDLCQISRIEKLLEDGRFLKRFFAEEEQTYILSKGKSTAQTAAGIFASKEAYVKAVGSGFVSSNLSEICVLHNENGAPYYEIRGKAYEKLCSMQGKSLFLSITHEGEYASAVCVLEG